MFGDGGFEAAMEMARNMALSRIRPYLKGVFEEHDADDVRRFILVDYPLVKEEMPAKARDELQRYGGMVPEGQVKNAVTAERVHNWLKNPEWANDDEVEAELHSIAAMIETTPGGMSWLEDQVEAVWEMANIDPEE